MKTDPLIEVLLDILFMPTDVLKGGPGSGHRGHEGRPGHRGGSLPGDDVPDTTAPRAEEAPNPFGTPPRLEPLPADREWVDEGVYTEGPNKGQPLPEETINLFVKGDTVHPERRKMHEKIINDYLATAPKNQEEPHAIFMVGGPGAGKSSILATLGLGDDYVRVEADGVKEKLPEFQQGVNQPDGRSLKSAGWMVHRESTMVAKEIKERAFKNRQSLVVDGTGDNIAGPGRYLETIKRMQAAGYRVTVIAVDLDVEDAIPRIEERARKTGRFVREDHTRESYATIPANVMKLRNALGGNGSMMMFNTTKRGPARLVLNRYQGKEKIYLPDIFAKYEKAAEAAGVSTVKQEDRHGSE